jgi:hypothetical protein
MYINEYDYIIATEENSDYISINDLNRTDYIYNYSLEHIHLNMVLDKPTAILYAAGTTISTSECRDGTKINPRLAGSIPLFKSTAGIRETTAYAMHKWIGKMTNKEFIVYANINCNTCSSSMYSLWEAEMLLKNKVCDEVIIITEEKSSFSTTRIFKELNIPLMVSDGIAVMRLGKEKRKNQITDCKWSYEYNVNPFLTTKSGYAKVDTDCNQIKPHGTGTNTNDAAEASLVSYRDSIYYKDVIGHSQGASALLEICLLLDDNRYSGDTLCVASGLGGFYGSCIVKKGLNNEDT